MSLRIGMGTATSFQYRQHEGLTEGTITQRLYNAIFHFQWLKIYVPVLWLNSHYTKEAKLLWLFEIHNFIFEVWQLLSFENVITAKTENNKNDAALDCSLLWKIIPSNAEDIILEKLELVSDHCYSGFPYRWFQFSD